MEKLEVLREMNRLMDSDLDSSKSPKLKSGKAIGVESVYSGEERIFAYYISLDETSTLYTQMRMLKFHENIPEDHIVWKLALLCIEEA